MGIIVVEDGNGREDGGQDLGVFELPIDYDLV
jgi:hypothetical protein